MNNQIKRLFFLFLVFGLGVLVLQDEGIRRLYDKNGMTDASGFSNLFAVQADPPKMCGSYTGQCTAIGQVYCQDPGGEKYPVVGAIVSAMSGRNGRFNKPTDSRGFFKLFDETPKIITSFVAQVTALPPNGKLPTGQLYSEMKNPKSILVGGSGGRIRGPTLAPGEERHWEIVYSNCSGSQDTCESQVQISVIKESPNILTFSAYYRLAQNDNPDNKPVTMVFHLEKDGQRITDSPPVPAQNIGMLYGENGETVYRYVATWSYTVPVQAAGAENLYRVVVDPTPAAPKQHAANTPYQAVQEPAAVPEIYIITPSLKLGTFEFVNVGTGCKELTFKVLFKTEDIVTPTP